MKIREIMQTSFLKFQKDTPIKEVARSLFFTGISSAPVVSGNKLVGIISEEDILEHMYPTISGIYKDKSRRKDTNWMESHFANLLDEPAKKIMNVDLITLSPDSPAEAAQSLMLKHNFMIIPVVDKNNNLLGVVSESDMFRELLKEDLPKMEWEQYAGFVAENYDAGIDWKKRFELEFPTMFRILKKNKSKVVLDVGSWTGEYAIGLAKEGYEVIGLDHNPLMIDFSNNKRLKLEEGLKKRVKFLLTGFTNLSKLLKRKVDTAICMGNSLPYLPGDVKDILAEVKKTLRTSGGILVIQALNMDKVLNQRRQLLNFEIKKREGNKILILEFLEKGKSEKEIIHNVVRFDYDCKNWNYKGVNSISIKNIGEKEILNILKELGFKNISVTGNKGEREGQFGQMSLVKPFDPETSEWMTVIAHT